MRYTHLNVELLFSSDHVALTRSSGNNLLQRRNLPDHAVPFEKRPLKPPKPLNDGSQDRRRFPLRSGSSSVCRARASGVTVNVGWCGALWPICYAMRLDPGENKFYPTFWSGMQNGRCHIRWEEHSEAGS